MTPGVGKRWAAGFAVAAVLAAVGCDDSSGSANTVANQARLNDALLTVADLPPGWKIDPVSPGSNPGQTTPPQCQGLFDDIGASAAIAEAQVAFSAGATSISHQVSSYEDDAAGALTEFVDALGACPEFVTVDRGLRTDFTADLVSFPNFGDRTEAVRMTGSAQGLTITLDAVLVSIGRNGFSLLTGGLAPVDPDEIERLAKLAADRLRTATG